MPRIALSLFLLLPGVLLPARACAGYEAGWDAYRRGDYARAFAELVPAADRDARAALALAHIYEEGEAAPRDAHQALLWRRRAAELGDRAAQLDLAERYLEGRDVPADAREAAVWYTRAAEQGDAAAQFALGRLLSEGSGIAPDADAGRQWIERAAENGSAQARRWLGRDEPPAAAPQAPAPVSKRSDQPERRAPQDDGDPTLRPGPEIHWGWGMHYGIGPDSWHRGGWYPWGWYSWGWYPYGWYPYGYPYGGYPRSSVTFGFTFSN